MDAEKALAGSGWVRHGPRTGGKVVVQGALETASESPKTTSAILKENGKITTRADLKLWYAPTVFFREKSENKGPCLGIIQGGSPRQRSPWAL